jgi:DnaJ like chaperone protein
VSNYGPWIGGAIGWALGGPIGGILGYSFGKMFAGGSSGAPQQNPTGRDTSRSTRPGDFAVSLLVLSAAVMKADDKVLKSELDFVKSFLKNNFGPAQADQLTLMLRETLSQSIDTRGVAEQIRLQMDHAKRLLLLQYLFGIAKADGHIHSAELDVIRQIAKWLGIHERDRVSIEEMFQAGKADPYSVLEIDPSSTDSEVKKAYRKMAVKFHPDKVQDLGESHQKQAKERFIAIQAAYEQIKLDRGMK